MIPIFLHRFQILFHFLNFLNLGSKFQFKYFPFVIITDDAGWLLRLSLMLFLPSFLLNLVNFWAAKLSWKISYAYNICYLTWKLLYICLCSHQYNISICRLNEMMLYYERKKINLKKKKKTTKNLVVIYISIKLREFGNLES